jgi:ribosomal protein L3
MRTWCHGVTGVGMTQVFLSGAVHGDERVGPVTVLEAIKLMVQAAKCVKDNCQDSGACLGDLGGAVVAGG